MFNNRGIKNSLFPVETINRASKTRDLIVEKLPFDLLLTELSSYTEGDREGESYDVNRKSLRYFYFSL